MHDCLAAWTSAFGAVSPLGHALRKAFTDRWVRFHALPDAKRYATDEAESAVVLSRGNVLATGLMGEGATCWLIMPSWRQGAKPVSVGSDMALQWSIAGPTADFDEDEMGVYAKPVIWRAKAFDGLLTAVANDKSRALFAQPDRGRVFAPYDGGFDAICQTKAEQATFKARHTDWLSARADML